MDLWMISAVVYVVARVAEIVVRRYVWERLLLPHVVGPWLTRRAGDRILREARDRAEREGRNRPRYQ